jgi:hypothetical protein
MRRSRSEWSAIVGEFERGHESHAEFCARRRLNVGSFRGWLYRLRGSFGRHKVARSATPRMLPVRTARAELIAEPRVVEIGVASAVVRVAVGTDVPYVVELIGRLRDRC